MNTLANKALEKYVDDHTSLQDEVLRKLERETYLKVTQAHMVSGHLQGQLLTILARSMNAKRILEIGTFTGYSGICLARGLSEGGKLYTLEVNEELEEMIRKYFEEAKLSDKLDLRFGNALDILPEIDDTLDLVFIDADKGNYDKYFELVIDKVRTGGLIIADNVIWKGKVYDENANDKKTQVIRDFNKKVQDDPRVENVFLPIRDGLLIACKK
ncbi:putative O-methyltransferase YrrM [Sediminitomix flava]|uniref:Putative O-methyltransferase YrrM n=2 Tax=Sediminitomix flava TaxID=379075 RepID=A0A315ZGJ6_SEDFL|nr:O-methyltransferase [Sediminitomix flava]PWJ44462.1 putative O-methyltransferase YrrM [Sediminitomix flava]